jgi:metal-responsive CopG/Arc/MetJ family transcriptional regulator
MPKTAAKAKTSVTLSRPLLVKIDKLIGEGASRSAYIEKVLSEHLRDVDWRALQIRDMERINAAADELNAEAMDVLTYQVPFL